MPIVDAGALIDVTSGRLRKNVTMHVDGSRISAVVDGSAVGSKDAIDLAGLTVVPGLIDAHAHLGLIHPGRSGQYDPPSVIAAEIFRNCHNAISEGFTTIRDVGGLDGGIVEAIARGLVKGPRILPSGAVITQTGGHLDHVSPWAPTADTQVNVPGLTCAVAVCDGVDGARRAARVNFRRGATQLKVCVSGGIISFSDHLHDTQFGLDELTAIVAEARARRTYVCAHAHGIDGIRLGLAAGVACFEHVSFLDEQTAREISAADAAVVPTLTTLFRLANEWEAWNVPKEVLPRMEGVQESMCEAVLIAHKTGLLMGSGSDILGPNQVGRGMEIRLKAELIGAMPAIQSATLVNARILRRERDIGSLEPGKIADLIAVDGDPLAEPGIFEDADRIVFVMADGVVVKDIR